MSKRIWYYFLNKNSFENEQVTKFKSRIKELKLKASNILNEDDDDEVL